MVELSKRLLTIASFVKPGSRVADVGTDHGYLPIYLIERGIADRAIAMDIRKGPLTRAEEHIREAGLEEKIETRLGNGLEKLKAGEADTVTIAGMGGPLMLEILQAGGHVVPGVERFILSPQSDWGGFRLGLEALGLGICREEMVFEDGKYYLVVEAVHRGENRSQDEEQPECDDELRGGPENQTEKSMETVLYSQFGRILLTGKHPVLREYLLWQEGILTEILHKLTEGSTPEVSRRRAEVEENLACVRAALDVWLD